MAQLAYCCVPLRYVFAFMGFMALVITDETNLTSFSHVTSYLRDHNKLDKKSLFAVYSSYYWAYAFTQIISGPLAQHFGGKCTVGFGVLFSALTNLALLLDITNLSDFLLIRVLIGIGNGLILAGLSLMLSRWTPPEQRTKMAAFVYSGAPIGSYILTGMTQLLVGRGRNTMLFYTVMGIVWFVVWVLLCYDKPGSHPYINEAERNYLKVALGDQVAEISQPVPLGRIVTSLPVWALVVASMVYEWSLHIAMIYPWPLYSMSNILNYRYINSSLHPVMWICCMVVSCIADGLISSKRMSITSVRKLVAIIGSTIPAISMLAVPNNSDDGRLTLYLVVLIFAFLSFSIPSLKVNTLDLGPNFSGIVMALITGASMGVKIVLWFVWSYIFAIGEWHRIVWYSLAAITVANLFYFVFASGEVQDWNKKTESKSS